MNNDSPYVEEFKQDILNRLGSWRKSINDLRKDLSVNVLKNLQKEIHKASGDAEAYGFIEMSKLCKEMDLEIISKSQNIFLTETPDSWYTTLEDYIEKIEKSLEPQEKEKPESKDDKETEPKVAEAPKAAAPTKTEKKKVVIVDDDDDILNLLEHEFHEIGFEVEKFKNGNDAQKYLLNEDNLTDVFLIVLDRMLPDMDGLDILQKFLAESPKAKIPVLIVSALNDEKDIVSGLQKGAIDYITKPFSVFMLMQKAMNLLEYQ